MIGYPFINEFFTNVLAVSNGIQGRFFICPKMGTEINLDDLDQVIEETVKKDTAPKNPLAIMMPPSSVGDYSPQEGTWEEFNFIMFFLKTTYYNSANQVSNMNVNTGTSKHTIPQDWHDMKRCAVSFIQALKILQRDKPSLLQIFRLSQKYDQIIRPISGVGKNRMSGVRLDFRAELYQGCTLEDYDLSALKEVVIPVADSHPEHKM